MRKLTRLNLIFHQMISLVLWLFSLPETRLSYNLTRERNETEI